jgi:multicomponent Na+:H+ antiporter subunit E
MIIFLWNILLAITWTLLTGQFTLANLIVGLIVGYFTLWIILRGERKASYFNKMNLVIRFIFFYLWNLILASLKVAYEVITPQYHMRSGVIAVPLDAKTDVEITVLANLITITPGTLSLDVSTDRRVLYIHAMYIDDKEELVRDIKMNLEKRVLEMLR